MTHADTAIDRFNARRHLLLKLGKHSHLCLVQTPNPLAAPITYTTSRQFDGAPGLFNDVQWDDQVSPETIDVRIGEFTALYDRNRMNAMWLNCRTEVLYSVANTFGIGKLVASLDKTGGNVDTVHNVKVGIYASEVERQNFENRGDYNSTAYHAHDAYKAANARNSEMLSEGTLIDTYTGEVFPVSAKNDAQRKPNLDHVVAAKNIHDDAGRVLAGIDGQDLANTEVNLTPTSASINKAKGTKTAVELQRHLDLQAPLRKARIEELKAKGDSRTDQEDKQLTKLQLLDKVDPKILAQKEASALSEIDKTININYYTSAKFAGKLATTGVTEGLKMGMQQALGEILVEFFESIFDEITNWVQHGRKQATLIGEIKARLYVIAQRCEGKLQAAMHAFKQGSISGFFANLVNTLINTFFTTSKRIVRMIREGFYSLVRGIQMLLFPKEGMTYREAAHEASKILLVGGIAIGGISIEEWLEKQLIVIPMLASIASFVVPVIVGALTSLVTTLGVYLIDQADLLGVMRMKRFVGTTGLIDESIDKLEAHIEAFCINRSQTTSVT